MDLAINNLQRLLCHRYILGEQLLRYFISRILTISIKRYLCSITTRKNFVTSIFL